MDAGYDMMYIEEEPTDHKSWRGSMIPVRHGTFFRGFVTNIVRRELPYGDGPYYEVWFGKERIYVMYVPDEWLEGKDDGKDTVL